MSKLLVFLAENQKFDADAMETLIAEVEGVTDIRTGAMVGAVFECRYGEHRGTDTIVRISETRETITLDGDESTSTKFALELQSRFDGPMRISDMNYSFDLHLKDFNTADQLLAAMRRPRR